MPCCTAIQPASGTLPQRTKALPTLRYIHSPDFSCCCSVRWNPNLLTYRCVGAGLPISNRVLGGDRTHDPIPSAVVILGSPWHDATVGFPSAATALTRTPVSRALNERRKRRSLPGSVPGSGQEILRRFNAPWRAKTPTTPPRETGGPLYTPPV
jgi:hypothetical protein